MNKLALIDKQARFSGIDFRKRRQVIIDSIMSDNTVVVDR